MGMEFEFVPSVCKGEDAKFSGSVVLRSPTFDERYEYMEKAGFKVGEGGEVEASTEQLGAVRRMVGFSKAHYAKVDITRKSDGEHFDNLDALMLDPSCDPILIEVAMACMTGIRPGKN
jgi:hypothetical protein